MKIRLVRGQRLNDVYAVYVTCAECGGTGQRATARSANGTELDRHDRHGTHCDVCHGHPGLGLVPLDPAPSQRLFNHSPDGFAWGYGGSGPAQLALALLLAAGIDDVNAVRLHQDFKDDFVACWPDGNGEHEVDVEEWAFRHPAYNEAVEGLVGKEVH